MQFAQEPEEQQQQQNVQDTRTLKRAVKQHPDKGGDPAKYRSLSEAYEILKDPVKRDLYDKYGLEGVKAGGDPNGGGDFFSFFNGGQQNQGPKKCKPKLIPVKITLQEAFHGGSKQQTVTRVRTCEKCQGKGGANSKQCTGCKGARYKEKLIQLGPGMYTKTAAPCDDCKGQGIIFEEKDKCENCKGERVLQSSKVFQVTIEPGVPHENDIIYTGQADQYPGTLAGDLYFRVLIEPHSEFRRKGADLYYRKKISLLQSLTGVTFSVKLLDDTTIICSTSPGQVITNHEKKIIKHKGMPFYKESMSRGHLVVTFDIEYPQPGQINQKDYAKLAGILGQPLGNITQKTQNVKVLEHYEDPKAHHEEQGHEDDDEPQGQAIQCQNQ